MAVRNLIHRWPLLCYFALAYLLSAIALAVIGLPKLDGAAGRSPMSLVMFPVMVIGVGLAGVSLTALADGRSGLADLRARFRRRIPRRWLAVLLIPPCSILAVLGALSLGMSSRFTPQFFGYGIAAGILAGFSEELGWTGFAYPRLRARFGWLPAALLLGVLWGLWHLPVVDSLGAASPHGRYWPEFFAAFVFMLAGLRVLIAWTYVRTGSLRLAQLLHASSTGFLVVLSAPRVTPGEEALWYFLYAAVLWIAVITIVCAQRGGRVPAPASGPAAEQLVPGR
jgi:membrane protease YdiL (CAAX protease family)